MNSQENWKKFCEAKDDFIDALEIARANCLLKEAGTNIRLKRKENRKGKELK